MYCSWLSSQHSYSPFRPVYLLEACALLFVALLSVGCGGSATPHIRPVMGRLTITGNFPAATVNTAYSASLIAKGGVPPYRFSIVTGALPNGLSLNATSGGIAGTPTSSGAFNFTAYATDLAQDAAGQQSLGIQVSPGVIAVSLNPGSTNLASGGTQQFTATVKNSPNTAVIWAANVGFISNSGLYTAPSVLTPTTLSVTATSVSDPTKSASASVVVQAQTLFLGADNRYCFPGDVPNFGTGYDGPAQLPTNCINSALSSTPSNGNVIFVASGGDIQGAVDSAACGDTVQLQAGGAFGPLALAAKACDASHWITIRTSAPDAALPPEGTRVSPCYAGIASLPGRPALNCVSTTNVMAMLVYTATSGSGPITLLAGANHYRLIGLEITRAANAAFVGELVSPVLRTTADHIIFDRVWIHGTAQDDTTRAFYLSGISYFALVDSYLNDFHCEAALGSCTDSQDISGGLGDSQDNAIKIVNNFLEAAAESVIFGGGRATTTPGDIEVRRNHFFKPLIWMPGQQGFVGGYHGNPFIVKNHFELKNGQRALFEGNLTENVWGGFSQAGFTLLLTPKNQHTPNGDVCPLCQVTDVTVRYNKFSHSGSGFQIANAADRGGGYAQAGKRYSFHDLILEDVNATTYGGQGQLAQISSGLAAPLISDLLISHVTAFPSKMIFDIGNDVTNPKMPNFGFANSIVNTGAYPVWSTGGSSSNCSYADIPNTTLTTCFANYAFGGNGLVAVPSRFPPSVWPTGNYFIADVNSVGFLNFNNGAGGDYHLLSSSAYKNAGSDGKDLGADVDAVDMAIAGVD